MNKPRLSKKFDPVWSKIINRSDGDYVYTSVRWSPRHSGYATMSRALYELYEEYRAWSGADGNSGYFEDFAKIVGLTSFILTPQGKVELTANIAPKAEAL